MQRLQALRALLLYGAILPRHLEASRQFFGPKNCAGLVLACDGSRVAGKDVLLVAILGVARDGCKEACWVPPQVTQIRPPDWLEPPAQK